MITFRYNESLQVIECSLDDKSRYISVYLEDGSWVAKKQKFYFPMNKRNIDILFTSYNPEKARKEAMKWNDPSLLVDWKNSLREAILDYLKHKVSENVMMGFLSNITIENVHTLPYLIKSKSELLPFKNQHISQYWGNYAEHHALLWEMGTGKTRASIEMFEIKKNKGLVDGGLVVCPLSMVNKWVAEIEKWSDCSAIPFIGKTEDKIETFDEHWDFIVVTFESFARYKEHFLKWANARKFVILDEVTKIKNPHAKRTKALLELGLITKHKVILTGTPVTQHAYDVFAPMRFLDNGETFGFNYDKFIDKYYWKRGFKYIAKSGSVEEISEKLFTKSTRFLKNDCIDIPDKVYDQRILDLPPYNRAKYNEMVQYCITQIEGSERATAPIILTQLLRLSQITSGFIKDVYGREVPFEENPKMNALEDILEDIDGEKVIIWSRFQYDIEQILALCKKIELKAVSLYGKDNNQVRNENIRSFQEDADTRVIVGTTGTGGHGIDLVAGNLVIYYANDYSLEKRLQSEDRAHRAGQKNKVTYIDLLCKDTVDLSIYKILRAKKNIADIVTKDTLRGLL